MPRNPRAMLAPWLELPRAVHVIFFAQIVNRIGDFALPLLTLYLTRKLGLDSAAAGALVMAAAVSSLTGTVIAGKLADRLGRKPVLLAFQGTAAGLIGLCGFLPIGPLVPGILVLAGIFQGGVRPSLSAIIIDSTSQAQRKTAFSLSYLGINIGVAVGPMFVGFLFERHLAWIFWLDAASTLAAIALVALLVPETHPQRRPAASPDSPAAAAASPASEAVQAGSALGAFLRRPELVGFGLILLLTDFMYTQTKFGLALWNNAVFGADGARWYGILMSCNAVTVLALTLPLGWLTRRLPVLGCVGLGALCYVAGFGMLAFRLDVPLLLVSTVLWTIGEILFATNVGAWFAQRTPANQRGRFQGILALFTNTGSMASPLACGLVMDRAGVFGVWGMVAGLGAVACLGLAALWWKHERPTGHAKTI